MHSLSINELKKFISLLRPSTFSYTLGLIGCGVIDASVATLITTYAAKDAVDAAARRDMSQIINTSVKLSIAALVLIILVPIFNYLFSSSVKKIISGIRINVFDHMVKLPIGYFENTHSGDSVSRITNDIGVIENALNVNIRSIVSLIITGVFSSLMMLYIDWRLASVLILMGLISTFVNVKFAGTVRNLSNIIQKNAGVLTERFIDMLSGFVIIKMFNIYEIVFNKYKEVNDKTAKMSAARSVRYGLQDSTNFILIWICNGGTFIIGSYMIINGQCSLGSVLVMILLLSNVTNLFRQLGNFVSQLQPSLAGAFRVFELLDIKPEPDRYGDNVSSKERGFTGVINGVFSYVEGERVIDNLTLTVEKGSMAAIVGLSGSGKSTIIKMLLGFYPLDSGSVIVDGKDIGEYTLTQLREIMAYIPQDVCLFEGTIEENIRYGRIDALHDEVIEAAKAANAHEFIMEQPEGYGTMVGERGTRLSGGQKQRIAIARAIIKDAPILLLDEATSALDSESEQLVQDALNRLMRGRTTITVAHRLSTIKNADLIYVIDNGKIVEQGRHEELLLSGGLYNRLFNMQFGQSGSEAAVN